MTDAAVLPEACLQQLSDWAAGSQRKMLGIVAPPGAGKSTFAKAIHAAFPLKSQIVPMDGFHLANVELARLNRAGRKGAADTFDSVGFHHLLQRIRLQKTDEIVYAPDFRRDLEEAVAGAIAVVAATPLILIEGNYLLLDSGAWALAKGLMDEVWYLDVDERVRRERLLQRHMQFGRNREEALAWMVSTDDPNARMIESSRPRADRHIDWVDED